MAKRFGNKDQIALMQLIAAVAKLNKIKQPEAVSSRKLHNAAQRIRCHFDHDDSNAVKNSNRSNQHSKFPAIDIDFQQCRAIERQGVDSVDSVCQHYPRHIVDTLVGLRVSVMPLRITLDQQVQGVRVRVDKRFGSCRHSDIDHGGNRDCGQAAKGIAFCGFVH